MHQFKPSLTLGDSGEVYKKIKQKTSIKYMTLTFQLNYTFKYSNRISHNRIQSIEKT